MSDFLETVKADPYANLLGIQIDRIEEDSATCSIDVTPEMMNFLGVGHGGLVFSLADVAFAAASNSRHSPSYALDVSGSFLRAAMPGDRLVATAELVHTTKRTGLYRMQVHRNGDLVATFNGTVFRK